MVKFSDFIGEYFFIIADGDFGKDNYLHCKFCGGLIYRDGDILKCCDELEIELEKLRNERKRQIKIDYEMEKAEKIGMFTRHISESNLEGNERGYKFSHYKTDNAIQAENKQICQDYADSDVVSLMISGTVGTGKTMLAITTAKKIAYERKISIDILRCSNIYEKDDIAIKTAGVLVIDDIGRESGSEARSESRKAFISEVIESRMRNGLKTIFTTNLSREELLKEYKSHILDRIFESSVICKPMKFESKRGNK